MKKLLFLLIFISSSCYAVDLSLPGSLWMRYDRSLTNETSDVHGGRLCAEIEQGIAINRNILFARLNVYNPFELLIDRDNFYSFGLKHKTKLGLNFGIERQFVRHSTVDYNRDVVFTEYSKEW